MTQMTRGRVVLAVAVIAIGALYLPRMIALFPLQHDVTFYNSAGDDWFLYHRNAVNVLRSGLTMPRLESAYSRPLSFGYPYFIALVYAVFGVRSEAVYLIQGLLLVGSIFGMFAVFRTRLSRPASVALLLGLALFMYADVYRSLTFRLLGENVLFPLLPLFIYLILKGELTGRLAFAIAAGVVCGLGALFRPNLILFAPATAAVIGLRSQQLPARRVQMIVAFLSPFVVTFSLMPVRNYAVTGRFSVPAITDFSDWSVIRNLVPAPAGPADPVAQSPDASPPIPERVSPTMTPAPTEEMTASESAPKAPSGVTHIVSYYAARLAYVAGIPQFVQPTFQLRPHWLLMWCVVAWYVATLRRRTPAFWEVLVMTLAVSYLGPLLVIGNVSSYGTRMIAPAIPLVLLLAVKGLDVPRSGPAGPMLRGLA